MVLAAGLFVEQGFLGASYWLDECITSWVISDNLPAVFSRAITYQGQSPFYYLLAWSVRQIFGDSELALRGVSFALLVCCVPLIFQVIELLHNRESALVGCLVFIVHPAVLRALSARPYALALFFALLSMRALLLWQRSGRQSLLWLYVLFVVATFYAHYLFCFFIPVQLAWVLNRRDRRGSKRYCAALVITALLMMPGFDQLYSLFERRESLSFVLRPSLLKVFETLLPLSLLVPVGGGLFLARVLCPKMIFLRNGLVPILRVAVLWWLSGPILFLLLYWSGVASLFHERYFLWNVGGLSLLIGALFQAIYPDRAKLRAFLLALFLLFVAESERHWQIEDWRRAAAIANTSPGLVLLSSGLVESSNVEWLYDSRHLPYLTSALSVYGVREKIILAPATVSSPQQKQYLREKIIPRIESVRQYSFVYLLPLDFNLSEALRESNTRRNCKSEVVVSGPVSMQQFTCG